MPSVRLGYPRRLFYAAHLGWRDLGHEFLASVCQVVALAAIITPLLVLFGIKSGVIRHLTEELASNIRTRQVSILSEASFPKDWIDAMAARPEVGFIQAHTRTLAASADIVVRDPAGKRDPQIQHATLLASGPCDPMLPPEVAPPDGASIVVSTPLQTLLGLTTGQRVELAVSRQDSGGERTILVPLTVTGTVNQANWDMRGALVDLDLLVAIERWRDGNAVPERGWNEGRADTPRGNTFPNIRLYAADLASVEPLVQTLIDRGLEVRSQLADVKTLQGLDRSLTAVFVIITAVAALGGAIAFGASLWGNVVRKLPAIGLIRLIGMERSAVASFPLAQALTIAFFGAALAAFLASGTGRAIDLYFARGFGLGDRICLLEVRHMAIAAAVAVAVSLVASIAAVSVVVRSDPKGGLSDG